MNDSVCQACEALPVEVEIPPLKDYEHLDPLPFRLCLPCSVRFDRKTLRPREWFNLARLHGGGYMLGDHYYDQAGRSWEPLEEVKDAELFPMPTVSDFAGDIERLVDLWIVYQAVFHTSDELTIALKKCDAKTLLDCLKQRVQNPNPAIESVAYCIAGDVLKEFAAHWIQERQGAVILHGFASWTYACVCCLPANEALMRFDEKLKTMTGWMCWEAKNVLGDLRNPIVLEWIETNIREPVEASWGRLAALSQLSWPKVLKWLKSGYPLSLVALDAMNACWNYGTAQLKRSRPKILDCPSIHEMTEEINIFSARNTDNVIALRIEELTPHLAEIRA